ncbi:DUF5959 family protein [Nocardiopsis sp. NPDC060348]|uniref:DUF5959 family protein n=1 Tax=unclassified Nocardiopsis TaxID=2649073 RepID=UPI00364BC936
MDALHAEERVEWPSGDRTGWVVVPKDPVEVTVHDTPSTQTTVRMPIDVTDAWLEENRLRLEQVRQARQFIGKSDSHRAVPLHPHCLLEARNQRFAL